MSVMMREMTTNIQRVANKIAENNKDVMKII